MGFFKKMLGSVDDSVMKNGILARGEITQVDISRVTIRVNNKLVERKCTVTMNVMMDKTPAFQAKVTQKLPEIMLPRAGTVVPVRVDPNDHSRIFIDMNSELPVVTLPRITGENSADYIMQTGKPIKVVLIESAPQKMKNADGFDIHTLKLTVYEGVETPYQLMVSNAVPATALPLLYPGSRLHAKLGSNPNFVVVDWAAGAAG